MKKNLTAGYLTALCILGIVGIFANPYTRNVFSYMLVGACCIGVVCVIFTLIKDKL
jgi:hypothetical protein